MKLRLFVALDLPGVAVAALERFRDAAAEPAVWRPLPPESFHVTLAFLGWCEQAAVAAVAAALPPVPPLPLALGDGLLLPPRGARVLTVALEDASGALAAVQAEVAHRLQAAGVYEPEARPFRPHVTVARLRRGARAPRVVPAAPEPLAFSAGPVVLYRSHLGAGGARYEPLASSRVAPS